MLLETIVVDVGPCENDAVREVCWVKVEVVAR